jgi:hypothetical protein
VTKVPGDTSLDGVTLTTFDVEELAKNGAQWQTKYDELLRGVEQVPSK